MVNRKTTLILGAGASHPYGYPLGSTLRSLILQLDGDWEVAVALRSLGACDIESFVEDFRGSELESIDTFLSFRPEYSLVGRQAIAAILLDAERKSQLGVDSGNWVRYLINRLVQPDSDLSNLSVVTFNYDRSLEQKLFAAFQKIRRIDAREAARLLSAIEIVHVYGDIGEAYESGTEDRELAYGCGINAKSLEVAVSRLRVIPEGRDSDPSVVRAKALISSAERLAFLGFGFDAVNLARLGFPESCVNRPQGMGNPGRKVVASCMHIPRIRQWSIFHSIDNHHLSAYSADRAPPDFIDADCLSTLRETAVVG